MSDFKRIPIKVDAATGRQIDSSGAVIREDNYFRLLFDETVIVCAEFFDIDRSNGTAVLVPHPIPEGMILSAFGDCDFNTATAFMFQTTWNNDPELNHVNAAGDWIENATANIALGQASFRINTNTTRFPLALAAATASTKYYFLITGVPEGEEDNSVLAYFRIKAENRPSSSVGEPEIDDPLYLQKDQVIALVNAVPVREFSVTGLTGSWHSTQTDTDGFYHESKLGGAWSDPMEMIVGPQGPQGIQGGTGAPGASITDAAFVSDDMVFTKSDLSTVTLTGAKTALKGNTGNTGATGANGLDAYMYVAYASDASGTGWSLTPSNSLRFRAEIHSSTALTPVVGDFSGATWVRYAGYDLKVQYSIDGSTSWHDTYAGGDAYCRLSVDNGGTYSGAMLLGIAGANGATILSGSGDPSGGNNNDIYINETTQDVFKKVSGSWGTAIMNIKGATGTTPNFISGSFTNASLSSGILTISHTQGNIQLPVGIFDNNGKNVTLDSGTVTFSNNSITVDLTVFDTITGTWKYAFGGTGTGTTGGSGDVVGSTASTDANIVVYNGINGKSIKDGGVNIASLVPASRTVNGHDLTANVTVTKSDVGLGNVPNTDATNPLNITQSASCRFVSDTEKSTWNGKESAITAGTSLQYWRGDKSWQTLPTTLPASDVSAWAKASTKPTYAKSEVGLDQVDNTSDANKPVSTAQQTALNAKQNAASTRYSKGNISGAVTIDRANGDYQVCITTGNVTGITISNLVTETGMILRINNSGAKSVTFGSTIIVATTDTGNYACSFYNDNGTICFMGKGTII